MPPGGAPLSTFVAISTRDAAVGSPVLGRLFSSNRDNVNRTEIVLLITPRVIRNLERPGVREPGDVIGPLGHDLRALLQKDVAVVVEFLLRQPRQQQRHSANL